MGSGDAILCADHPILGQAVIVLHLDYPNCYESQDAFSSGHVECTSLPHRSDVVKFLEHWNSCPILLNIRIPTLSFRTLQKFRPYPFKNWNSNPLLSNIGIPPLSSFKLRFSGPILSNIGIPTLSFQTLVFHHYPLWNIGILALSFQTLEFRPYPLKHWNCGPIFIKTGIPALSFQTLEFQPFSF